MENNLDAVRKDEHGHRASLVAMVAGDIDGIDLCEQHPMSWQEVRLAGKYTIYHCTIYQRPSKAKPKTTQGILLFWGT